MTTLGLYALLSTAFFYLGSRAMITAWLWSRYSPGVAQFMDCSACSGFWYGFLLSLTLAIEPVFTTTGLLEAILVGLCMLVLTPLVAGLMQHALFVVGSAIDTDSQGD